MLEVRDLEAGYQNMTIVDHVTFSLEQREIMGIVGESGCGKSTLLKSINLLPGTGVIIHGGEIIFNNKSLSKCSERELRNMRGKDICMIFQKPEAAMDPLVKIKDQFYETVKVHDRKVTKTQALDRSREILKKLHFENADQVLESYPFELSGGMNQRAAIAMAMINEPELILADEPTSALDVTVQSQVVRILKELRDTFGTSVLIVTHNMNVMAGMTDKLGVMYGGQMVEYGNTQDVISQAVHPYTKALLQAIPAIDGTIPKGIEGHPPSFGMRKRGCAFAGRCSCASDKCRTELPRKTDMGNDHWVRCFETGEGR